MHRYTLPFALLLVTGCGYNTIQKYDETVNAAKNQIEVQLQRRADLIPNLVATVKGYAQQEQDVFVQVAQARALVCGKGCSNSRNMISSFRPLSHQLIRRASPSSAWRIRARSQPPGKGSPPLPERCRFHTRASWRRSGQSLRRRRSISFS